MNFNNTVIKNKFPKSLNVFILQSYVYRQCTYIVIFLQCQKYNNCQISLKEHKPTLFFNVFKYFLYHVGSYIVVFFYHLLLKQFLKLVEINSVLYNNLNILYILHFNPTIIGIKISILV
jgi:hypothetical protein